MLANYNQTKLKFPHDSYAFNKKYNFLFCPIPKVACSSLKRVIVLCSDHPKKQKIADRTSKFHAEFNRDFTLSSLSFDEAIGILSTNSIFKFTFVRNPWDRLVSAYLNKFVNKAFPNRILNEKIEKIQSTLNCEIDLEKSISFHDFVNYICLVPDDKLDKHWKPQYRFLAEVSFDFIGKFENLYEDYNHIKNYLNLDVELLHYNKTEYADNLGFSKDINYADFYPNKIEIMSAYPAKHLFYSPKLIEMVRERYRKDIEMFNYEFISK